MSRADQPTSVRFSRETLDELQRQAEKKRWGVSFLVRHICEEWLTWARKQDKPESGRHKTDRHKVD